MVRRQASLTPSIDNVSMRFSLFQICTAVLVIALSLALIANHRLLRLRVSKYETEAEGRERLEDKLEFALLDSLESGVSLDEYPYYRLLLDDVVTVDHPAFKHIAELVALSLGDDSASSYGDCEFHLFQSRKTIGEYHEFDSNAVVVRNNRCVEVAWIGTQMESVEQDR